MKKILSVIAILFVVFSASAQKSAKAHHPQKNHAAKKQLKKELHLTTDQTVRLKETKKQSKLEIKQLKENKSLTKAQKHEQLKTLKIARKEKMNAILTADQQKRLAAYKQANKNKKHAGGKV